jgi:hypothetical protein
MFPSAPTSRDKFASYGVIVRHNGVVVEGRYTLDDVSPSEYSRITCIYYNDYNVEISRSSSTAKPGYCDVTDAGMPGVKKLEMQVEGIFRAPTGGSITLAGTYAPTGRGINYGNIFGRGNSEMCTTMRVNANNMPYGQVKSDPYTGALTWTIAPQRLGPNYIVRLQNVLVNAVNAYVGMITIVPFVRQQNGQPVQLNSISGQPNIPITGFPNDYSADIVFFVVTMFPAYSNSVVNPNQASVTISVDYCYAIGSYNTSPNLNGIQPYFIQNDNNNIYNPVYQQSRMSIYIFILFY